MKIIFSLFLIILSFSAISYSNPRKECEKNIQRGIALLDQKEYKLSLELLTTSLKDAKDNAWAHEQYMATINIGSNYYHLGDLNEAVVHYLKAYELAKKSLDKGSQMASINNIAVIYFQDRDFENAYSYFKQAFDLADQSKAFQKQGLYALNLALVSNKMKELNRAWEYIEKAELLLAFNVNDVVRINLAKAEWFLLNGQVYAAKDHLLQVSSLIEKHDLKEDQMLQQMLLAEVYTQKGKYDLAISHILQSIKVTTGKENLINAYLELSDLYQRIRNYPLALAYKDSVLIKKDALFNSKLSSGFEKNKIKFQLLDSQQQLKESKLQSAKNRVLLFSLLSISVLLLTIATILLRSYKFKQQQHREVSEMKLAQKKNENIILEKQLKEKEALAQLEKERYKNEMDTKNREILGKVYVQSSQNEAIQKLVDTIEKEVNTLEIDELHSNLEGLKKYLKQSNHWQTYFLHFEKTNPGFTQKIRQKHPDLTANELRFITYIYINLSNKEIASLLNISYDSVRKRKERLAKKLNLPSSSELYSYFLAV